MHIDVFSGQIQLLSWDMSILHPYLVQPVAQLLEQFFQGINLINTDCNRHSHKIQCLSWALPCACNTAWLSHSSESAQCVSCASCSWLAKLPPRRGLEPIQPIHLCYRIPAAALKKQIASCFNRGTANRSNLWDRGPYNEAGTISVSDTIILSPPSESVELCSSMSYNPLTPSLDMKP